MQIDLYHDFECAHFLMLNASIPDLYISTESHSHRRQQGKCSLLNLILSLLHNEKARGPEQIKKIAICYI